MVDPAEQAVRRAIDTMQENLGEQLTIDDIARAAMFSKFHFTRIFQRSTGVSPGRFLSALRLQRAKQLLVSTSLNVADISLRVGYNSIGTFSSRFSRSVGMSPTTYRRQIGFGGRIPTNPPTQLAAVSNARVYGDIDAPCAEADDQIFVGLFPDRIPEGLPARCVVLNRPGPFCFETVPVGAWYLLAQSTSVCPEARAQVPTVCVGTEGPLTIRRDTAVQIDLALKPIQVIDPPVLLALLNSREAAVARAGAAAQSSDRAAALVPGERRAA
ncbi:helix-turn-helix domain-containing protein [Dactylosporangium cerinum]|uniref:Helix-turn-helix domain-containing protein n=1 Tax=Dactylosporangium cerinum TaxID=1434730 RepID=A0ABV9VRW9_9ACTN